MGSESVGRSGLRRRTTVVAAQLVVLVAALVTWSLLPRLQSVFPGARFLDPYFISSPAATLEKLIDVLTGRNGGPLIWEFVWPTFSSAIIGTLVGLALGGLCGLVLSSWRFASDVLRPYLVALNAVPRIAFIPIVVVIFGNGRTSSIITAIMIVFFLGLFSAYEGGRTVEAHVLQNARLLGASNFQVMWRIRAPFALAWILAGLPVAVSFSIIAVVTGELLTGGLGMGMLINQAAATSNVRLTFAVVIVLSVLAIVILGLAELVKRRVLHWWTVSDE